LSLLIEILKSQVFQEGKKAVTKFLDNELKIFQEKIGNQVEVVDQGLYCLIQDYPGRLGHWDVGVSPSGPMDSISHRKGNYLVGNSLGDASIEILLDGLEIKFYQISLVAVTGS
jgi:urea carboxylase